VLLLLLLLLLAVQVVGSAMQCLVCSAWRMCCG
jgi:hypothetical protein